jgi:hypothetical protein
VQLRLLNFDILQLNKLQQELKHLRKQKLEANNCIGVLKRLDARYQATGTEPTGARPQLSAQSQQLAVSLLNYKIEECRVCGEKVALIEGAA